MDSHYTICALRFVFVSFTFLYTLFSFANSKGERVHSFVCFTSLATRHKFVSNKFLLSFIDVVAVL